MLHGVAALMITHARLWREYPRLQSRTVLLPVSAVTGVLGLAAQCNAVTRNLDW